MSRIGLRLFVMMLLEFFIWGAWLPLIWSYMGGLGFTGTQVALVGSTFAIASIVAIFAGNQFVDRTFSAEKFLAGSHLVGGMALLGLYFVRGFAPFFALMLLHSICYVPTISVANAVAFTHLKDARRDFGWVRMGGTIGWMAASWPLYFVLKNVVGPAMQSALGDIFLVGGMASLGLAAFSLTLPPTPPRLPTAANDRLAWRSTARMIAATPFLLVLFAATFLDSIVQNGYFLLTGGFLANAGIRPENIMPIMSLGQISELIAMAVLGLLLKRLGWKWTLVVGVLGQTARFLVFALYPANLPLLIAVQLVHGICYACFFATLYIFIDVAFPTEVRASAQGWFNLLVLGVGDLAAKWLLLPLQSALTHAGVVNYRGLFLVPAGLALATACLLLAAFRPPENLSR